MPPFATFKRLGELSTLRPPTCDVYGAVTPLPGSIGGVKPAGIVNCTGELEFCSRFMELGSDPEPVMMAPLRLPSIDSELPIASTTCGCAGIATVSGTSEIWVGMTAVAE